MPENNVPSAKPDPEAAPGEFDFAAPITEKPRVRRRALQEATKPVVEVKTEKISETPTRPATAAPAAKATPTARPASSTAPSSSTASTAAKTAAQPTSPHGTRPATLYYSSGPRPEKEYTPSPAPMKPTPTASPSPSASTASTSAPRTTATAPASTASTRPASSVVDYRSNVDRQSREQKSVGGILTIIVYVLVFAFVSGSCLAGYGLYVLSKQLDQQSVTMHDFDQRYAADYKDINARLVTTQETLGQAQAQIAREQDLINKQQDTINKLLSSVDDNATALRQEKATRATETANLRTKIKDLEYQGPTTRKY